MKDSKTYKQKIRDQRWINLRHKVLERDKFRCKICFPESEDDTDEIDNTVRLNVHHKFYWPNFEPWDYPQESLITLCEQHHEDEDDFRSIFFRYANSEMRDKAYHLLLSGKTNGEVFEILTQEWRLERLKCFKGIKR